MRSSLILICVMLAPSPASSAEVGPHLDAILNRWRQLPAMELRATFQRGNIKVSHGDVPWNKGNWEYDGPVIYDLNLVLHAHQDDWQVDVQPSPQTMNATFALHWLAFVRDEYEEVLSPNLAQPLANIRGETKGSTSLLLFKFLTPLERQFFETPNTWPRLIADFNVQAVGHQVIDEYVCIRFEGARAADAGSRKIVTFCLAPELGYAPVQAREEIHFPGKNDPLTWEMRALEHRPVGDHWIIAHAILVMANRVNDPTRGYDISEYRVTDVRTGPGCQPKRLRNRFPEGTLVRDFIRDRTWNAGARGRRLDERPLDKEMLARMAQSQRAQFDRPQIERSRRWAMIAIHAAGFGVAALLFLARRRWIVRS